MRFQPGRIYQHSHTYCPVVVGRHLILQKCWQLRCQCSWPATDHFDSKRHPHCTDSITGISFLYMKPDQLSCNIAKQSLWVSASLFTNLPPWRLIALVNPGDDSNPWANLAEDDGCHAIGFVIFKTLGQGTVMNYNYHETVHGFSRWYHHFMWDDVVETIKLKTGRLRTGWLKANNLRMFDARMCK